MTTATRSRLRKTLAAAALLSILASLAVSEPALVAAAPPPAAAKGPAGAEAAKAAPSDGAAPAATATLPLGEYERLAARPSVTVVDTLRVVGSFAGRDLSLVVIGRAAGVLPQIELLSGPSTLRLHGCEGDAILSRSAGGVFELLPQSGRFTLRCRIAVPGTDSLQLQLAPSVLWAESAVQDGELVRLEDAKDHEGWRELSIVRTVESGAGEPLQPSLTARYHLMLQPEATEFLYRFEVRNPNRAYLELTLPLSSGEQVQRVDTTASYELGAGAVKVKLPPGEVTVQLMGSLRGERFMPKVAASVQYALVDSHPLLRPVITTAAQRISVTETGLSPRFSYSQAFLFSKGPGQALSWQVHKLEALRTTSFAVNTARHVFFLASDGAVLGETALVLANQGAPSLTLRSRAEPTFASLQDAPVLLTKDEGSALFLPLGQGRQDVLVQHRQALRRAAGFAWGTLHLPDPGIPASHGVVELRYEQKWQPLFESLPPEPRFPSFGLGLLFGLLALFVVTERLLAAFAVPRGARIAATLLLTGAAYSSGLWLGLLLGAELVLGLLLLVPWVLENRPSFWTVVGGLAVGGTLCLILASMLLVRGASSPRGSEALIESRYDAKDREPKKPEPAGSPGTSEAAPAYQGLPAKIVMPGGHDHSYLSRELLSAEHHGVFVIMVSRPLVALVGNLMLGLALILLALNLQALRSSLRARWQRIFSPRPEQAP